MVYIVTSQFEVANGMEKEVERAFKDRPHKVDDALGFIRMDVLRAEDNPAEFMLVTYWETKESYETWHHGHNYAEAHLGIPKGLKLVQGKTKIRSYAHVST